MGGDAVRSEVPSDGVAQTVFNRPVKHIVEPTWRDSFACHAGDDGYDTLGPLSWTVLERRQCGADVLRCVQMRCVVWRRDR